MTLEERKAKILELAGDDISIVANVEITTEAIRFTKADVVMSGSMIIGKAVDPDGL